MVYNALLKVYPDGTRQFFYGPSRFRNTDEEKAFLAECMCPIDDPPEDDDEDVISDDEPVFYANNLKRAKRVVYDLARSNPFDYFITLTFSDSDIRYDYRMCTQQMKKFTDCLRKAGNKWILVSEQHKDGAFHFHGLVQGELKLSRAYSPYTGMPIFDESQRPVYNVLNYKYGFTTAVPLDGSPKVATYVTKYLAKKMDIPKGAKRYWASRSLARPSELLLELESMQIKMLAERAIYSKKIISPYGDYQLIEF